jgi:hypothetical protein
MEVIFAAVNNCRRESAKLSLATVYLETLLEQQYASQFRWDDTWQIGWVADCLAGLDCAIVTAGKPVHDLFGLKIAKDLAGAFSVQIA